MKICFIVACAVAIFAMQVKATCPPINQNENVGMMCRWEKPNYQRCDFSCHPGSTLKGMRFLTCRNTSSMWNGASPNCLRTDQIKQAANGSSPAFHSCPGKDTACATRSAAVAVSNCPPIDLPKYAYMHCFWKRPGVKECRFTCRWDTNIIGRDFVVCEEGSSQWDRSIPVCIHLGNCPPTPPVIISGTKTCNKVDNITTCRVMCHSGYFMQGPSERTCDDNIGSWTGGGQAACTSCSSLNTADYRSIESSKMSYPGLVVIFKFKCENWTDMIGPETIKCKFYQRRWKPNRPPICLPNFSRCGRKGNPKCPKISNKELFRQVAPYRSLLSQSQQAFIQTLVEELDGTPGIRSGGFKRSYCSSKMCMNCGLLPKRWMRTCKKCKRGRNPIIRCTKSSGNIFG